MRANNRKLDFSKRLILAMERAHPPVKGATKLAVQFNLRFQGVGVSPQTAHKWLSGRAIPTPDKIDTLAQWLGVSAHWLHFGPEPDSGVLAGRAPVLGSPGYPASSVGAQTLAERIDELSAHQRFIVEQLVLEFTEKPDSSV